MTFTLDFLTLIDCIVFTAIATIFIAYLYLLITKYVSAESRDELGFAAYVATLALLAIRAIWVAIDFFG